MFFPQVQYVETGGNVELVCDPKDAWQDGTKFYINAKEVDNSKNLNKFQSGLCKTKLQEIQI